MAHSRRSFLIGVPTLAAALVAPSWLPPPALAGAAAPHQSPIHIHSRRAVPAPDLPALVVDYPRRADLRIRYVSRDPADDPTGCASRGREETVEAAVRPGTAAVHLGDVRYELAQFHFHTPSEHVLDGHQFPLEQHFVHTGPNGETLVVGLFLTGGGRERTVQDDVLAQLPDECGDEVTVASVDVASALPRELSTFRYEGSLTTMPNTERVSWLVLRRRRSVSTATLTGFRELFPDGDSRELQPVNGRVVRFREQR